MPKRKTVDADVPAEEAKPRAAAKPKAPAMHKRATKKTIDTAVPTSEPVRAISIEEISRRAYSFWEARGYQGGTPEEDWFRAERELLELTQNR